MGCDRTMKELFMEKINEHFLNMGWNKIIENSEEYIYIYSKNNELNPYNENFNFLNFSRKKEFISLESFSKENLQLFFKKRFCNR